MSTVHHVSEKHFGLEVLKSPLPVLVDFYADWCGPCRMLAPVLERLAVELEDRVKIVKVNVDENPGLANRFQVSSIPTLVVIVGGKTVGHTSGLVGEVALRKALNQVADKSENISRRAV